MQRSKNNSAAESSIQTKTLGIMQQPELGLKISELRKSKGYTQEELVEKCNISVRTIQRIEAGEVTPRSYTIKTILSALDYDLKAIQNLNTSTITQEFKKLFLLEIDDNKEANFLTKHLSIAWISGIIYFFIGFVEIAVEYYRYTEDTMIIPDATYIALKLITLASIILFIRGFILTGKIFKNYLLRVAAFIFIFMTSVFYSYDILSLFIGKFDYEIILGTQAASYGVIGIIFGVAVLRLQNAVGNIASITGVFELITYGFLLTIVLAIVGFVLLNPTIILEIILLYKVTQIVKAKQKELNAS